MHFSVDIINSYVYMYSIMRYISRVGKKWNCRATWIQWSNVNKSKQWVEIHATESVLYTFICGQTIIDWEPDLHDTYAHSTLTAVATPCSTHYITIHDSSLTCIEMWQLSKWLIAALAALLSHLTISSIPLMNSPPSPGWCHCSRGTWCPPCAPAWPKIK